ncbi:MAG: mitochondrial protein Pet127-domain-containing protein [Benjaminiella poitrasii]|nr:MAG: mitochondrial protein Pet127-domain-containing protein [Benjaminiella poitrasii]
MMFNLSNHVTKKKTIPCLLNRFSYYVTEKGSPEEAKILDKNHNNLDEKLKKKRLLRRKKMPFVRRLRNSSLTLSSNGPWEKIPIDGEYSRVQPPNEVPVATLAHGLDRVLFNPGVHYLKDPRTNHFNFTPFLENITQPDDFDFEAIKPYITSSKDKSLIELARGMKKRYVGSTSSVSGVLSQFYFLMSNFKPINTSCLSEYFKKESKKFTRGMRTPASIYLRWNDGVYAVDVDKSYDIEETILSVLGKSLEKVLTLEPKKYERYLKENSAQITDEERNQPESYAYGELGQLLLRSQLDCHDSRLPRGTFDLKTRAAIPVRLDIRNYTDYLGYTLKRSHGLYESFEREYYDMIRSAFLKYNFQVRIGHMDGILVAYHNTRKIFGFQYVSREEMDIRLFGSSKIGNQVFHNALVMFESVLNEATRKYPQQTLRISLDTRQSKIGDTSVTYIFVEPVPASIKEKEEEHAMDEFFQTAAPENNDNKAYEPYKELTMYKLQTKSFVNGKVVLGPLDFKNPTKDKWKLWMNLKEIYEDDDEMKRVRFRTMRRKQASISLPNNKDRNPLLDRFREMSERCLRLEEEE